MNRSKDHRTHRRVGLVLHYLVFALILVLVGIAWLSQRGGF